MEKQQPGIKRQFITLFKNADKGFKNMLRISKDIVPKMYKDI